MKKVILSAAAIFCGMAAQAQFEKGRIIATGDLSFSSSSSKFETTVGGTTNTQEGPKNNDFGLGVSGGFFLADNLAVGLGIGYNSSSSKLEDPNGDYDKISSNIFIVNPFARYYIPYSERFALFTQLDLGFGFGGINDEEKIGNTTTTDEVSLNTLNIGISPGFTYFLHENIGLDIRYGFIGYSSSSSKFDNNNSSNKSSLSSFDFDLSLNSLRLGLSVFF